MTNTNLQNLLERNMTRKQFLATSGAIALTALGVTGTLKKLGDATAPRNISSKSKGFGSTPYGK